jgi:hypothetical protein
MLRSSSYRPSRLRHLFISNQRVNISLWSLTYDVTNQGASIVDDSVLSQYGD